MFLNILKGTSCRKTGFWVMGLQSQNISKYIPKVNFEISHTLESSMLNLEVTWNQSFSHSTWNWPLNFQNTNTLYRFQNFTSLFLKINFSPLCYNILNKTAISQECNVRFRTLLHQNWGERTAIKEIAETQFWSSETTGPFRCGETHIINKIYIYIYMKQNTCCNYLQICDLLWRNREQVRGRQVSH